MAKSVKKLKDELNLKGVVLTIAGLKDPGLAKWGLNKDALHAVLYKNLKVEALHSVTKDKLDKKDDPALLKILDDVKTKLKAER
jgi:hypothetical protein